MGLTDTIVLDLRRTARDNPKFNRNACAKLYGINLSTLTKALTGISYKHLNDQEPPVVKIVKKADEQETARQLYKDGKNYNEIARLLNVAKSSISYWCRDLAEAKRAAKGGVRVRVPKGQENPVPIKPRSQYPSFRPPVPKEKVKKVRRSKRFLTNEDVIAMRKEVKEQGYKDVTSFVSRYGVSASTISLAISGKHFSDLNEIEAPVVGRLPRRHRWGEHRDRRCQERDVLIQEAIRLRREDPIKWTYAALAKWMSEKTGKTYHSPHISRPMLNRDPSLRELEKLEPPKPRRKQAPRKQSVPRKRKTATVQHVLKARVVPSPVMDDEDAIDPEVLARIEEEDRYEAAVAAGLIKVE